MISGQLFWSNDGADCSLLLSPENVKVCWPSVATVVTPWALEPLAGPDLSSIHGTGTSLPVLVFASVPELGRSDITAKSIRPDAGLKMTSLIVPSDCPCPLLTSAPIILLARTS